VQGTSHLEDGVSALDGFDVVLTPTMSDWSPSQSIWSGELTLFVDLSWICRIFMIFEIVPLKPNFEDEIQFKGGRL
jgi:hypothetical protein